MLFLTRLLENCRIYGEKTAVEFVHADGVEIVSYAALETAVLQTAAYLQTLGIQPGDRVAIQLPKGLPFLYLHLAIMRLGAITLPLNPAYPAPELAYFLENAAVKLFFADAEREDVLAPMLAKLNGLEMVVYVDGRTASTFAPLLTELCVDTLSPLPTNPNQVALMIYTSGTTGRPKGAQLTHGNLTANIEMLHVAWGWQADDVLFHVLPIFHLHGLFIALHGALHAGATAVLHPKFDAQKTLEALAQPRCTVFMAVPTIHKRLLAAPNAGSYDLSHMRLLTSGSDRLPDDIFLKYQKTFGQTLLERYGMTETSINLSNPLHGERRVGSVGLPLPGVEARIADPETDTILPDGEVGEVQIRGPHVFSGYWQMPQKTADAFTKEGWLRTGDMGLREPDGYFTLKGRAKDLIISGGFNVYPSEVELVLSEHPAVAASAVVGQPDEEWGERVTAVVVLQTGKTAVADELIRFCRERIAAYKAPREIVVMAELPQNALGKVQKAKLRQILHA